MAAPEFCSAEALSQDLAARHGIDLTPERLVELAELGYIPCFVCDGKGPLFRRVAAKQWIMTNLIVEKRTRKFPTELTVFDSGGGRLTRSVPAELTGLAESFGEFPLALFQPSSCVYFLIRAVRVVYVGQTACLAERISQHRKASHFPMAFDRVLFLPVPADEAVAVENAFIRVLKPEYNSERFGPERAGDRFLIDGFYGHQIGLGEKGD
jgi:hypothetical protein